MPFGRRVTRQLAMQAEPKMHLSYLPPSIHPHPTHTGQSMACDSLSARAIDWVMQLRTYTVCRALDTLRSKRTWDFQSKGERTRFEMSDVARSLRYGRGCDIEG